MTILESFVPPSLIEAFYVLSLDNPINLALLSLLIYLSFSLIPSSSSPLPPFPIPDHPSISYNWRPRQHPSTTLWKKYTPKELQKFDGKQEEEGNGKILFAIRRKVYDVTAGKSFYGPGGPYEIFAGRDASRGLAKQSFEPEMLTSTDEPIDSLEDLTDGEWNSLKDWESHFQTKYFQCGDYVEPN